MQCLRASDPGPDETEAYKTIRNILNANTHCEIIDIRQIEETNKENMNEEKIENEEFFNLVSNTLIIKNRNQIKLEENRSLTKGATGPMKCMTTQSQLPLTKLTKNLVENLTVNSEKDQAILTDMIIFTTQNRTYCQLKMPSLKLRTEIECQALINAITTELQIHQQKIGNLIKNEGMMMIFVNRTVISTQKPKETICQPLLSPPRELDIMNNLRTVIIKTRKIDNILGTNIFKETEEKLLNCQVKIDQEVQEEKIANCQYKNRRNKRFTLFNIGDQSEATAALSQINKNFKILKESLKNVENQITTLKAGREIENHAIMKQTRRLTEEELAIWGTELSLMIKNVVTNYEKDERNLARKALDDIRTFDKKLDIIIEIITQMATKKKVCRKLICAEREGNVVLKTKKGITIMKKGNEIGSTEGKLLTCQMRKKNDQMKIFKYNDRLVTIHNETHIDNPQWSQHLIDIQCLENHRQCRAEYFKDINKEKLIENNIYLRPTTEGFKISCLKKELIKERRNTTKICEEKQQDIKLPIMSKNGTIIGNPTDIVKRITLEKEEADIIQRMESLHNKGYEEEAEEEIKRAFETAWTQIQAGKITPVHVTTFGTGFLFMTAASCCGCLALLCRRGRESSEERNEDQEIEEETCEKKWRKFWSCRNCQRNKESRNCWTRCRAWSCRTCCRNNPEKEEGKHTTDADQVEAEEFEDFAQQQIPSDEIMRETEGRTPEEESPLKRQDTAERLLKQAMKKLKETK